MEILLRRRNGFFYCAGAFGVLPDGIAASESANNWIGISNLAKIQVSGI